MEDDGAFRIEEPAGTSQPSLFTTQLHNSFFNHRIDSLLHPDKEEPEKYDFASLITVVSWLYSRRKNYLPFRDVDLNKHEVHYKPIAAGSTFSVTSTTIGRDLPSTIHHSINERSELQVVIKQPQGDSDLFDHEGKCLLEQQLKSFLMELLVLDSDDIYDDENIVRLLGVSWFHNQFTPYPTVQPRLILEHANDTLAGFLLKHSDLTWNFKLGICLDIARGLASLHTREIIHGDLTLNNILIFELASGDPGIKQHKAKIADFGHSFIQGTQNRALGGTHGYMAPEVVDKQAIDHPKAIDVYALGIVLWALLMADSGSIQDHPAPHLLLIENPEDEDADIHHLLRKVQIQQESHADERRTFLAQELIRVTIRSSPRMRNLAKTIEVLEELLRLSQSHESSGQTRTLQQQHSRSKSCDHTPIMDTSRYLSQTILIDYNSIIHASGVVHDQLVRTVERIAQDESDVRCPHASWELASMKISKFGDPNDMEPREAVPFIIQAAERGNMTAQGYCKRLIRALDPISFASLDTSGLIEKWLFQAAVHGNEAAYQDWLESYANSGNDLDEVMRQRLLRNDNHERFAEDLDQFKASMSYDPKVQSIYGPTGSNENASIALHWAALRGHEKHIDYLITQLNISIELKDNGGNTPLILACGSGNFSTAHMLILYGARLDQTNKFNETAMHHLWRFSDHQAELLLRAMVQCPGYEQAFFTDAVLEYLEGDVVLRKPGAGPSELDPLPLLPGFPIERMLGRGRHSLVKMLLQEGPALSPHVSHAANGNLIRRMILWASRLNFSTIRTLLVGFSNDPESVRPGAEADPDLADVEYSTWTYGNSFLDYMESIAQGWTSEWGTWRVPEHLWRLCVHGDAWKDKLDDSISSVVRNRGEPMCYFAKALSYARNMRHYDFFESLLEMQLSQCSLESSTADRGHRCASYKDPQKPGRGYDYFQSNETKSPLIERIEFSAKENKGTLLQKAIIAGDRRMFLMLVNVFGADIWRPWSAYDKGKSTRENIIPLSYINCYSLLAVHSKDLWFAQKFHQLGVPHTHLGSIRERYRRYSSTSNKLLDSLYGTMYDMDHFTPLFFAIDRGFLHLARFLLSVGASLDDQINYHSHVLDMVLQPTSFHSQTLKLLFGTGGKYRCGDGPECELSPKLLPGSLFTQENSIGIFVMIRTAISSIRTPHLLQFCRWIFSKEVFYELRFLDTLKIFFKTTGSELVYRSWFRVDGGIGISDRAAMFASFLGPKVQTSIFYEMEQCLYWKKMRPVMEGMWHWLEGMFPHAEHRATWKHPSLLCLAASLPKRIPTYMVGDIPLAFTETVDNETAYDYDLFDDEIKSRIFNSAVNHIVANTNVKYEPSLYDALVSNDFDICSPGSKAWSDLYDLGYRHGALYFLEVYLVYVLSIISGLVLNICIPGTRIGYVLGFPFWVLFNIDDIIQSTLPDYKWIQVPFYIPTYIFGIPMVLAYSFALFGNFLNIFGEVLIVRSYIRFKRRTFLIPLLLGKKTPYTGYTRAEYYAAAKRSASEISLGVSGIIFYVGEISVSVVNATGGRVRALWRRSRPARQRQQNSVSEDTEFGHEDAGEEAEAQRTRERAERRKRRERLIAAGKQGTIWTYKRVLRPAFIYTIINPLKWTIQAASREANFARQRFEDRQRRAMLENRLGRIRGLAMSDAEIGDEDLVGLEL